MNFNLNRILTNRVKIRYFLRFNGRKVQILNNNYYNSENSRNYSTDLNSYLGVFSKLSHSIANSSIVELTKNNLIYFHEWSSISWALEIGLITILFRCLITFPLSVSQHKILAKFQSLGPEIQFFAKRLKKVVDEEKYVYNYSPLKAKLRFNYLIKLEQKRLIVRDNCHPFKASIVMWFQIPFWVILSHTIRNMSFMYPIADQKALYIFNQLSNEGILWFTDLTHSDPYFILPVIVGIVNLANVQLHSNERLKKLKTKTRTHKIITNSGRVLSVALIPIAFFMPSSVCFYWFISSTTGLIQSSIIYSNKFKQLLGLENQNHLPIDSIQSKTKP